MLLAQSFGALIFAINGYLSSTKYSRVYLLLKNTARRLVVKTTPVRKGDLANPLAVLRCNSF
jgi:hypothetical protein